MALGFLTKESIILGYRSGVSEDSLISGKAVLQKAPQVSFTCGCFIPSLDGKQYSLFCLVWMEITFRERDVNRCANSYGAVVIPLIFSCISPNRKSKLFNYLQKRSFTFSLAQVKSETVFLFCPDAKYTRWRCVLQYSNVTFKSIIS